MVSSHHRQLTPRATGALFVLLVFGAAFAPTARAGCGHEVSSKASRAERKSLADLEVLRYSGTEPADSTPADPRRKLPCSGASCSQGQDLPQAPVTSSTLKSEQGYCTACTPGWGHSKSPERPAGVLAVHPRHSTSPLERPPRNSGQALHS